MNVPGWTVLQRFMRSDLGSQMIRYGISGVGLTLFYSLIYLVALDFAKLAPLIANGVAFAFTIIAGYLVHSNWSFRDHGTRSAPALNTARFLIVNILGFALNSFWVWVIAERLALSPRLPLIPIVLITPWLSFWLNRRWTFG
jgi:putative flippase GtrA